jgi:putative thioredoxin
MAYLDVTDASFEADVLERSVATPVVVDLWAPWCGPCRQLGPAIEKVVEETNGKVILAKVNVDDNPRISATFKVQSIPAVYALADRKIVDQFIGAIPENQIRAWVARFAPAASEADQLAEKGDEASLRQALEVEPGHPLATIRLAELLVDRGETEEALQLLAKVPETPDVRRVAALARTGASPAADGDVGAELDALIGQVKGDDTKKQRYLDLLAVLGDDPRVPDYRRKLASVLF